MYALCRRIGDGVRNAEVYGRVDKATISAGARVYKNRICQCATKSGMHCLLPKMQPQTAQIVMRWSRCDNGRSEKRRPDISDRLAPVLQTRSDRALMMRWTPATAAFAR